MCNCTSHVHSFACYLRNLATEATDITMTNGTAKNAR